jgi:beta-galactosidase GanA
VFGGGAAAEEIFMAWHFARFTQHVTSAGKAEYPLPMFVNAALIRPGYQPGQYPSAGPLPHLIDVWRAGAPAIDFIAPDIYFPTFVEWTRRYVRGGNPLFIPEALRGPDAAVNALYAFAEHDALGFSPFAIESIGEPAAGLLAAGFERSAPPSLADGAAAGSSTATAMPAGGLVIATGADEFLFAGIGVTVTFAATEPGWQTGILSVEEGRFVNGRWQNVRWLNGDETHQGRHLRLVPGRLSIQRIKLYRYR